MGNELFRTEIGRWEHLAGQQLEALARQACLRLAERVVESTPVVTGNLRSQWQPSLNGLPVGEAEGRSIKAVLSGLKLGDAFWMTNGTEYGWYVEAGTSKFAGRHFVSDNVAAFGSIVAEVAAEMGVRT